MIKRHRRYGRIAAVLAGILLAGSLGGCAKKEEYTVGEADERALTPQQNAVLSLSGRDALGRTYSVGSGEREGTRYVGLWYSLWLGQHPGLCRSINNIQELLDEGEDGMEQLNSMEDYGQFYFWGEPLYGYYSSTDEWVVNRHVELFTMADLDYLMIDATNEHIYEESMAVLAGTLLKYQAQGFRVPQVCFYTNTNSGDTVDKLYAAYYEGHPEWDSLWFKPNGKPLIVATTKDNNNASDMTKFGGKASFVGWKLQEYFDIRESQWPNGDKNDNGLPWMSWDYPQYIHNGAIAVPVAQHSHTAIDASLKHPESSRGYNNVTGEVEADWTAGRSFGDMWETVFANDDKVNMVLMTSFNEWQAQHLGPNKFVDVYNNEFSRDIEMMKGGYGDNFYLQMVENVRRWKLSEAVGYAMPLASPNIKDPVDPAWDKAQAYADFTGDCMPRYHLDAAGAWMYRDNSDRNDITEVRMIHDSKRLYVRITCAADITVYEADQLNWMNLLIGTEHATDENSFAGYDFIINRKPADGKTAVEKSTGGYSWETAGEAAIYTEGKYLCISIPWSVLGVAPGATVRFKVADNVTAYDDIMDYYVTGDAAPIGRLSYTYGYGK